MNERTKDRNFEREVIDNIPYLERVAYNFSRNKDDIHDLVYETLYKVLKNRDKLKERSNLKPWAKTILKNNFISMYRKRKSENVWVINTSYNVFEANDSGLLTKYFSINDSTFNDDVLKTFKSISKEDKLLIQLVYCDGFSYKAASDFFQVKVNKVRSRLFRCRNKIKNQNQEINDY